MAIPKFEADVEIISKLGDFPGKNDGLTNAGFKAKFDEGAILFKKYINDILIPEISKTVDEDTVKAEAKAYTDAAKAEANAYTDAAKAEANAYTDASVRRAAPRNLLDNSDFRNPVNQRGIASGAAVASYDYFIDRWINGEESSIAPKLSNNGIKPNGAFYQLLDSLSAYVGKKMTFAVGLSSGNVVTASGTLTEATTDDDVFIFDTTDGSNEIAVGSSGGLWYVWIDYPSSTIQWAALYEGEYAAGTLPEYHPKGYGAEIAECQRYYLKGKLVCRKAQWQFYNCWCNFPVTMRINNPTVTLSDPKDFATGTNTGVSATPNNVDANGLYAISLSDTIDSDVIIIDNYVASADL